MSQAGDIDILGTNPDIPTTFVTDDNDATPILNVLEILGTEVSAHSIPVETTASGNTVTIAVQIADEVAASDITKVGLAAFDSSQFTVDANGFVQINSGVGGVTIAGDSGSVTGSSITIYANNATRRTGSSVYFTNSGTISTFTLSDASYNIFLGRFAGTLSNSSAESVGIGYASMYQTQTSQKTSCFGSNSGYALTQDTNNTAIGAYSLNRLTTGSTNACLGYLAGNSYTSSESSNICVLSTGTLGESNTIRIGTQGSGAGQQNTAYMAGIVGVTVSNPVLTTINSSTGQLGVIASSNNSVLTTGATGVPTLTSLATDGKLIIGSTAGVPAAATLTAGSGISITNGSNSISIAVNGSSVGQTITGNSGGALSPTSGNWNILTDNSTVKFVGSGSTLTQDFSIANLVLGSSLPSLSIGTANVGIGPTIMGTLTSGSQNVAIGNLAFQSVTWATGCVIIGYGAGKFITQGGANTFIGSGCGALTTISILNTAVGHGALGTYTTGGDGSGSNACLGASSLAALTTGINNTACGTDSLSVITTGFYNIAMGYGAGRSHTVADSSNIDIGNSGTAGDSNTIRIGTQGSGSGQHNRAFVAGVTGVTVASSAPVGINSSGQLSSLGFGTSGQVLVSGGAGVSPSWSDNLNLDYKLSFMLGGM